MLTAENLTILLLNAKGKKGPNSYIVFHNLQTSILNITDCIINLKTLNSSSAFHSLSLEKKILLPLGTKLQARTNKLTIPRRGTGDIVKEAVRKTQIKFNSSDNPVLKVRFLQKDEETVRDSPVLLPPPN